MAKKKKKSLWQRAKAWFKETFTPKKTENKRVSNNTSLGRALNKIHDKAQSGYQRTYGSSGGSSGQQRQAQRKSSAPSSSSKRVTPKSTWQKEKRVSVADVMKGNDYKSPKQEESIIEKVKKAIDAKAAKKPELTDREQALKRRVQQSTHVVGNRVGKDFMKDARSGIYTTKATKKEKANVAKSIERDYNRKAKSAKASAVAGFTKSDANVRIATKAITGKDIDTRKVTKTKAYKGGDIAQEMASYAIAPTGAVEKGLTKAAVKGLAKKTLKKEGKKLTKEAIEKASGQAAKELATKKGREFVRKRAADTIANAGFNAKYAVDRAKDEKTGKVDKKEAVKDFAINTGMDIGIGGGLDAIKAAKGAKSKKAMQKAEEKISRLAKQPKGRTVKGEAKKLRAELASEKGKETKLLTRTERKALPEPKSSFKGLTDDEVKEVNQSIEKNKAKRSEMAKARAERPLTAKEQEAAARAYDRASLSEDDLAMRERQESQRFKDEYGLTKKERYQQRQSKAKAQVNSKAAKKRQDKAVNALHDENGFSDETREAINEGLRKYSKTGNKDHIRNVVKEHVKEQVTERTPVDDNIKAAVADVQKYMKQGFYHTTGEDRALRRGESFEQYGTKFYNKGGKVSRNYVDKAYKELQGMYGEGLFPSDNISEGDMLEQMRKVARMDTEDSVRRVGDYPTSDNDLESIADSITDKYAEAAERANPGAGKKIKKARQRPSKLSEADKVVDESPSRQELADLFGENQRQPRGKKVEGKLPERIKKQIDRKAEQTAQEPTSTITAEKTAKSTNTPTTEESTLKTSENRFEDIPNFYEEDARALEEKASEAEATLRKNAEAEDAEKAMQGAEDYDPIKDMVDTMAKREPGIHLPGSFEEPERAKAVLDGRRARAEETAQAEADFVDAATQQYKEGEKEAARQASKERAAKMDELLRGEKAEATKVETPEAAEPPKEKSDPIKDQIGRPAKKSGQAKVNQFLTDARRKFINSLGFSERYAEKHMPKEFSDTFRGNANNLRQATQRAKNSFADMQQDFNGNEVGESFMTIARDIASKGKEHYSNTEKYCYLLTHADRMDLAASKELDNLTGEYQKIEKAIENKRIKKEKGEELLEELRQRMDEIEEVGLEDSRANKRVFDNLTADEARAEAQRILDADPEVAKDAERIFNYFRNDLMSQTQAGLISEDTFRFYLDKMPNYVPAHRAFERAGYSIGGDATKLRPDELVAKGSGRVVLPIEDQALMSAEYTFTRGAQNEVAKQIAEMSGYSPRLLDAFDDTDGVNALDLAMFYDFDRGTLQFWDKGKMRSVDVDKNFLKDLQDMQVTSVQAEALNTTLQALGKGNRVFKSLITNFNPAFAVKNGIRDWPEGAFQSQDMMKYLKNYVSGKAAASILTNDEWYRTFKRMGVQNAQLINSAEDIFKDENWFKKNTLGRIEDMNEFVETLPRLSEFISFLEKRGKTPATATANEKRQAAEAAADVTVNFGRSGSIGRIINSSLVPFFNPAMQGWSKIARLMTKDKSVKGYLNLIAKGAMLGVAPAAVNEWLLSDNKNYQMINERDRAVNYYIPLDADNPLNKLFGASKSGVKDGEVFLKIPKARFLSVLGMGTQKAMGTTDIPWADIVSISKDQIAPVGWENNIFKPAMDSAITDEKSKGKTWYGADIETDYDQSREAPDRYDVNTSKIGIEIGKKLGVSPKKVDYLIDSYTGVLGDIALPASKKAAGRTGGGVGGAVLGYLAKNFSTDTVTQNNLTTKMYDRIDKLTKKKNSGDTSGKTEYGLWYLDKKIAKDASEIRKQIREIQDSDKSKNQKAKEIRPLQRKLNKITKTGIDTEDGFVKEAKKRIANLADTDLSAKNQKKYGLENAMIATAKQRGEDPWKIVDKAFGQAKNRKAMAPYAKKAGMDPVKFKEFYNIKAFDLDKNGYGSKSEAIAYLNSRDDLTGQEKAILFAGINKLFTKYGGNPFGDIGGGNNSKTAKAGGRRRYGRRRYGRRRYGRRGYSSKKASGGTPQKAPAKLKQTQAEKVSVASVMKTASAPSGTAQQKLIRSTTGNNAYTNAVKSVKSKRAKKDIYKIKATKS